VERAKFTKRLAIFTAGVSSVMAVAMIGMAAKGPVLGAKEPAAATEVSAKPAAPQEVQPMQKPTQKKARI